jgi:phosphotransferase system IIB component
MNDWSDGAAATANAIGTIGTSNRYQVVIGPGLTPEVEQKNLQEIVINK